MNSSIEDGRAGPGLGVWSHWLSDSDMRSSRSLALGAIIACGGIMFGAVVAASFRLDTLGANPRFWEWWSGPVLVGATLALVAFMTYFVNANAVVAVRIGNVGVEFKTSTRSQTVRWEDLRPSVRGPWIMGYAEFAKKRPRLELGGGPWWVSKGVAASILSRPECEDFVVPMDLENELARLPVRGRT